MGKSTDNLIKLANDVSKTQPGREMDMLHHHRRAHQHGAAVHGARRPGHRGEELHRQPGGHHHRHRAHQGQDPRGQGRPRARRAGRRARCAWSPASRASAPTRRSPRSVAAAATPRPSRWRLRCSADSCEIYTDVTGVFTADPRIVPQARKLRHVNFDEMLEMAGAGSKVLALRSVEFARNHNVPLHVRSAFTWEPGTWVTVSGAQHGRPHHLRRRHRHQRGQGHRRRRARPARHLGRAVRAAGRRRT